MTDLRNWPDAWLASPIVKKERINFYLDLLTLENGDTYLDLGYDLIKIKNERELNEYLRAWRT